jgi:hypothetical protein
MVEQIGYKMTTPDPEVIPLQLKFCKKCNETKFRYDFPMRAGNICRKCMTKRERERGVKAQPSLANHGEWRRNRAKA